MSTAYPKPSYEIDLSEDLPLAGLNADDDWILNANYIDKTFLRHVISYELFQEMNSNNKAAECKYVSLFLNQVYSGLYVLMEKLDKSTLGIDADNNESFIFKEPHVFRRSNKGLVFQDPNNIEQQLFPKITQVDKSPVLESIRKLILEYSPEAFEQEFPKVFDLQNIIDWHLLLLISNNGDGLLKNFYLYKVNDKTPIRVAPWDYDHSFGRDSDYELNLDTRPFDITRSILFERLLKTNWYKAALKKSWSRYNKKGLLSLDGIESRIKTCSKTPATYVEENFAVHPLSSKWYDDENTFSEELEIMYAYVRKRHARLTEYFERL